MEKSIEYKGKLPYTLTNDYMFKKFLQENQEVLKGLLSALLHIKEEDIKNVQITNPIEQGKRMDDKTMILDIKLILNDNQIINIEMQVQDLGDWEERSLTYLCRSFDQLNAGDEYKDVLKTVHIGILDFTPKNFPKELFSEYYMYNMKNGHRYSDKFSISMLQLSQLENLSEEEKQSELYVWARLFHATTWEEIMMLAEQNESIKKGIVTLRQLTADEKIKMECEARERYRRDMASAKRYAQETGHAEGLAAGLAEGRTKGLAEGRAEGRAEGQEKMAQLAQVMIEQGDIEGLKMAAEDAKYREKMYLKYNI